ncbi:MAG: hypothetical protein ACXWCZ_03845 [Flavisolibacter sp.]
MKKFIPVILLFVCSFSKAQVRFSFATDATMMRNFSPKQKFWAIGQSIQLNFHFTEKESVYSSIAYYTPGKFKNSYIASAKTASTIPSSINYDIQGRMQSNQLSMGWKHFWWGAFNNDNVFNIYSTAGFGLMFARIENTYLTVIDTSQYDTPDTPLPGTGRFKRLTFDLGLGVEYVAGGNIFIYSELKTWIPTTNYPSPYLHSNEMVPAPLILCAGFRILFGNDY